MKKDTLLLLALAGLGLYLVSRRKTTTTAPPVTTTPPSETYLPPSSEPTTRPPATYRPAKTYTPPPISTTPPVVIDQWAATTNQPPGGTGYEINGYFASGMKGGVIELPYGARWFHQEPTTTKNARMVL